jgi:hypothetical protein
MTSVAFKWPGIALISMLLVASGARGETTGAGDVILAADPRFDLFELSNSAGDHTFASPVGTVLLTFVSKDRRYCRVARLPSDKTVLLACREERGWKVEARSDISRAEATSPTAFGGGPWPEVGDAVVALMASLEPLDEIEIIEAAAKGWRDPVPVDKDSLDAGAILRKTAQVYMTSKSYSDTGTVETVYRNATREWTEDTHFRTAYAAPFDFRFESKVRGVSGVEVVFIAWRDRNGVRSWYNLSPDIVDGITSLPRALDAGAGISRDASGMIPGLIISGTKLGGDIVRLTDASRLTDAQIDGFDCFQVQGFRWPNTGQATTVWIDKDSFLIRRVYEEQQLEDVRTKTTWFYRPAINEPVDENALQYSGPAS